MSTKRWILMAAVLGSGIVFLDSTVVNVALPKIGRDLPRLFLWPEAKSRRASIVGGSSVESGTTYATTRSPHSGSGCLETAASLTRGCSASTASTSAGQTTSPPVRMASSMRPRTRTVPSDVNSPASWVRSQPSSVKTARVASASKRYPRISVGPRSCSSPSALTRTSVPGIGSPSYTTPPHDSVRPYVMTT